MRTSRSIRVEADGTQRLWRFTLDGRQPELVLERVKPVGYHAWADDHTLALFVLGQPATLQVADTRTGSAEVLVRGIGRSIQRIPGRGTISFVERRRATARCGFASWIRRPGASRRWSPPCRGRKKPTVRGRRTACCMMAEKDVLVRLAPRAGGWRRLADLAALGLHGVTRIAVSPKGDRIAFVDAVVA